MPNMLFFKPESITENRWWIYQKERFPVFKYGFLIAIFSGSAVHYPHLLPGYTGNQNLFLAWAIAFIFTFGLFLQMRIADEWKDYEDDCRYRPERAVPRGLVTRRELGYVGVAIAILQFVITMSFVPNILPLLFITWGYFGLMCKEFFVRRWLKNHLSIYMLSHMVILPLMALYCLACGSGGELSWAMMPFGLTCFFNGIVIEIGRKIRVPQDEHLGVETYSAAWQPKPAVFVWWSAVTLTAITALWSAVPFNFVEPLGGLLAGFFIAATIATFNYANKCDRPAAKRIDTMASIWTIMIYFGIGLLPAWVLG